MPASPDVLSIVIEQLNDERTALGEAAADAIYRELSSYRLVRRDDVVTSVTRNIARAIETLRTQRAPRRTEGAEAHATTLARARSGVPVEDILRAYRLSLRVIHDRFLALAQEEHMAVERVLRCSNLLWEVGDWFVAAAATGYRDFAVNESALKAIQRADLLREMLSGPLDDEHIWSHATALGLDPSESYVVFCAGSGLEPGRVSSAFVAPARAPLMSAEVGGRQVGIVRAVGDVSRLPFPVGVGPRRAVDKLYESARVARAVASLTSGHAPGAYELNDVAWRLAGRADPIVSTALHERYVAPALALGDFGELMLDSVRAFLREDQSVSDAARSLVVHPNTIRYRLSRYEQLVGVRLNTTRAVVELVLALDPGLDDGD